MYRSLGEVWDAYILADTATIEPGPDGYSELIEDKTIFYYPFFYNFS